MPTHTDYINEKGLVLLGCGNMGGALLSRWLEAGIKPKSVWVLDPSPSDSVKKTGVWMNAPLPLMPALCVLAVKPQIMAMALPGVAKLAGGNTLFLSIAAGTTLATLESLLAPNTPVIRAMPNTPAAVGVGMTGIVANSCTTPAHMAQASALLERVGHVIRVQSEDELDALTSVSGSGPAYVFLLIEALAQAACEQGFSPETALLLAKTTVNGAAHYAMLSGESPATLRQNVTSPNGVTAAALEVLMDPSSGFGPLVSRAVDMAYHRAHALGKNA